MFCAWPRSIFRRKNVAGRVWSRAFTVEIPTPPEVVKVNGHACPAATSKYRTLDNTLYKPTTVVQVIYSDCCAGFWSPFRRETRQRYVESIIGDKYC